MKKKYTIGISCIGSGVGQSVINSLKLSRLPLFTIGFGTNPFAYGAYDCDEIAYTPTIYADGYIDALIDMCLKHEVDLLIPGLDDEVLLFSKNKEKFEDAGINAIYAEEKLISLCRDKEQMSEDLNPIADVFVKSYQKETLDKELERGNAQFPLIAKPRGGFASRGIEILNSIDDLVKVDDSHIIQELAIPHKNDPHHNYYINQLKSNKNPQVSEVSIQLVYNKEAELMGRMASYNKLNNGIPIEVLPYDDAYMWEIVDQLTPALLDLGLRGPINIQGRMTDGGLKLFEMNPRFTGITGLRALMGFNEVEACVKEWLGIDKGNNKLFFNHRKFGMRQTADKAVPIERNERVMELAGKLDQEVKTQKKKILITGASGYLGRNLVKRLVGTNDFELFAFGRDKKALKEILKDQTENYLDEDDLKHGRLSLGDIDCLLHLGFARPHRSANEIAQSSAFTHDLFARAVANNIPSIINISTQSVYGQMIEPLWTEETEVAPATPYGQAKYASERVLQSLSKIFPQTRSTSIRLSSIAGGADGLVETDFMTKMVMRAMAGEDLKVIDGTQQMERLDIRDAVEGLMRILYLDPMELKSVYNFGASKTHSLLDIAKAIQNQSSKEIDVVVEPTDEKSLKFGLDSSQLFNQLGWSPTYSIEDSINSLFEFLNRKIMNFKKNDNLESLLNNLNGLLEPVEKEILKDFKDSDYPSLFLLGCPRAGSTLFMQWAVSLETFSYPFNFLSRFYKAPSVGALIYQMVTAPQYQYHDEFKDVNSSLDFESSVGKTKGFKAPHEFWYFWRQFHSFPNPGVSEESFEKAFDFAGFKRELNSIKNIFDKPFLLKAKIINPYLKSFGKKLDDVIYLHLYRDPIATAKSILNAREKWFGNKENWFSWKPREYEDLKRNGYLPSGSRPSLFYRERNTRKNETAWATTI